MPSMEFGNERQMSGLAGDGMTGSAGGEPAEDIYAAGHPERGYLQQMSPSVSEMKKKLETLSISFPQQMLDALKTVVESPMISVSYHLNGESYTSINELQAFPEVLLYRFSLPLPEQGQDGCGRSVDRDTFAFLLLDRQLPELLTTICFGGDLSSLATSAPDTSVQEEPPVFTRIGKQLLDQVANALTQAWQRLFGSYFSMPDVDDSPASPAHWMGGAPLSPHPFVDDCLMSRFDIEFHSSTYADSPLLVPVCFYTPVNGFTDVLVRSGSVMDASTADAVRDRIMHFLGNTEVDVTVDLESLSLPMSRLRNLHPGDVLPIPTPGKARLRIGNLPLYQGITGQQSGYLTMRISACMTGDKLCE